VHVNSAQLNTSVPIPKFVSACGAFVRTSESIRTLAKSILASAAFEPEVRVGGSGNSCELRVRGTSRLSAARTGYSCGLALLIFMLGSKALQNAVAEGDTRSITMHHLHTGEDITITYKRNGRYDEAALERLNWFLRDWRRGKQTRMDPHLIDLVWEVQREADSKESIQVVCGYRAPQTNAMLRRRSGGVARFSQHMLGHALDFYIPGVPLEHLREIGLRLQRGGVGFYPTSGSPFVHMDTGGVRMWPRMTHDELARVFPDGRTVHIPSDGKPLPGYAVALAEITKRGATPSEMSLDAARGAGVNVETTLASNAPGNPFAKLLDLARDDEEDDAASATTTGVVAAAAPMPAKAVAPVRIASAQGAIENKSEPIRLDTVAEKPAGNAAKPKLLQVAQLSSLAPAAATTTEPAEHTKPATPNDVIRTRGYWQGPPDGMAVATSVRSVHDASAKSSNTVAAAAAIGGPFRDLRDDDAPAATLAYAEQPPAHPPAASAAPNSIASPRSNAIGAEPQVRSERALRSDDAAAQPVPNGTTIVMKRLANQMGSTILSASTSSVVAIKAGARLENPWLRAVLVAPSVHRFLTTLALGARDFRSLAALMVKPRSSVMMTFAAVPNPGLDHERFSGPAVVFVSTINYSSRAAVVQ
jgi:uncharacterized protein YcbK (DUF882 family)